MDYTKMSNKKLSALLTSVDENEAIEIQKVLDSRNQVEPELSAEQKAEIEAKEEAFLAELEKNTPDETKLPRASKVAKMTYEECVALAESLKVNVGHVGRVVPFNTIEWVDCVIAGVIADKRSNKVLYALRCADGRNIVKAHDSKMLTILEETAEIKKRSRSTSAAEKLDNTSLMATANELAINVGRIVSFKPTKEIFVVRESDQAIVELESATGVIVAIVPDKRSGRILYRIEAKYKVYDNAGVDTEAGPATKDEKIVVHKVSTAADVVVSDVYDGDVRAKYVARNAANEAKKLLSPTDLLENAKKAFEKAKADVEKANKVLASKATDLENAQKAFNESVAQSVESEATEASAEEDLN